MSGKIYSSSIVKTANPNHHMRLRGRKWFAIWAIRNDKRIQQLSRSLDTECVSTARLRRDTFFGL